MLNMLYDEHIERVHHSDNNQIKRGTPVPLLKRSSSACSGMLELSERSRPEPPRPSRVSVKDRLNGQILKAI